LVDLINHAYRVAAPAKMAESTYAFRSRPSCQSRSSGKDLSGPWRMPAFARMTRKASTESRRSGSGDWGEIRTPCASRLDPLAAAAPQSENAEQGRFRTGTGTIICRNRERSEPWPNPRPGHAVHVHSAWLGCGPAGQASMFLWFASASLLQFAPDLVIGNRLAEEDGPIVHPEAYAPAEDWPDRPEISSRG
jgi:hypothetical protein